MGRLRSRSRFEALSSSLNCPCCCPPLLPSSRQAAVLCRAVQCTMCSWIQTSITTINRVASNTHLSKLGEHRLISHSNSRRGHFSLHPQVPASTGQHPCLTTVPMVNISITGLIRRANLQIHESQIKQQLVASKHGMQVLMTSPYAHKTLVRRWVRLFVG